MFYIVSYLVAFTIATRIGLSLGLQGLQIRYVDQINYSSSSSIASSPTIRRHDCGTRANYFANYFELFFATHYQCPPPSKNWLHNLVIYNSKALCRVCKLIESIK